MIDSDVPLKDIPLFHRHFIISTRQRLGFVLPLRRSRNDKTLRNKGDHAIQYLVAMSFTPKFQEFQIFILTFSVKITEHLSNIQEKNYVKSHLSSPWCQVDFSEITRLKFMRSPLKFKITKEVLHFWTRLKR